MGHRFVRVCVEYDIEVVDEIALASAALTGDLEGPLTRGEGYISAYNDVNAGEVVRSVLADRQLGEELRARLDVAGLRIVREHCMSRIRKLDDEDTYEALPEWPAIRDDGSLAPKHLPPTV